MLIRPDQIPLTIYADGLVEPRNPGGTLCWGWLALDGHGTIVGEGQGCLPPAPSNTNNQAEYISVLEALLWAWRAGYRTATVRSDSQLLVNQVNGSWSCNAPALQSLLARVRKAAGLLALTFEWVPREENTAADERSLAAYRAATGCEPPDRHPQEASASPAPAPDVPYVALLLNGVPTIACTLCPGVSGLDPAGFRAHLRSVHPGARAVEQSVTFACGRPSRRAPSRKGA